MSSWMFGHEYEQNSYFRNVELQEKVLMLARGPKLARLLLLQKVYLTKCIAFPSSPNKIVLTYVIKVLDNMIKFT